MNAEIKHRWLEALRSGRYKQGRHCLRNTSDKYCCLGVLCDVVDPDGWQLFTPKIYRHGDAASTLPLAINAQVQISTFDQGSLIALNDGRYACFPKIADWIEEHL